MRPALEDAARLPQELCSSFQHQLLCLSIPIMCSSMNEKSHSQLQPGAAPRPQHLQLRIQLTSSYKNHQHTPCISMYSTQHERAQPQQQKHRCTHRLNDISKRCPRQATTTWPRAGASIPLVPGACTTTHTKVPRTATTSARKVASRCEKLMRKAGRALRG